MSKYDQVMFILFYSWIEKHHYKDPYEYLERTYGELIFLGFDAMAAALYFKGQWKTKSTKKKVTAVKHICR